jgi:hypothetical protein
MTAVLRRVAPSRIRETVDGFERVLSIEPGYNDRGGKYGVHGMDLRFVLIGPLGAVHFLMRTGWIPDEKGVNPTLSRSYPAPSHIGWHWRTEKFGTADYGDDCDWLPAGCFYDASYSAADPVLAKFLAGGADAVWPMLREHYDYMATERSADQVGAA